MRRETLDLVGSGLLLAALVTATFAVLAPTPGASTASSSAPSDIAVASTAHERGLALFCAKGCVTCHRMAGVEGGHEIGPDLTLVAERAGHQRPGMSAEAYIRESLETPSAFIVPGYGSSEVNTFAAGMPDLDLSESEVDDLVALLMRPRGSP